MADDLGLDTAARVLGEELAWEVLLSRFAAGCPARPGETIREDDVPGDPLGPVAAVKQAISAELPGVEWPYPDRGQLRLGSLRFDFDVHLFPVVPDVMLHVRGDGDPLPVISRLCRQNGWVAVDLTTWRVLDTDAPSNEGWARIKAAIARNRGPGN